MKTYILTNDIISINGLYDFTCGQYVYANKLSKIDQCEYPYEDIIDLWNDNLSKKSRELEIFLQIFNFKKNEYIEKQLQA